MVCYERLPTCVFCRFCGNISADRGRAAATADSVHASSSLQSLSRAVCALAPFVLDADRPKPERWVFLGSVGHSEYCRRCAAPPAAAAWYWRHCCCCCCCRCHRCLVLVVLLLRELRCYCRSNSFLPLFLCVCASCFWPTVERHRSGSHERSEPSRTTRQD